MKISFLLFFALTFVNLSAQEYNGMIIPPDSGAESASWASAWGDYNNDGNIDLYVCNYYNHNFLYKNNGNGTFTKITSGAPVDASEGSWSSTWVDYDNDGDLDLYVINSYTTNNKLYRNNGNSTFTNVSSEISNTSDVNANNAAWADIENDGDLDLFLSNGSNSTDETRNENNSLYINNGDGTFTKDITSVIATDGGFSQFANWVDYDGDGDSDLIVLNTWQDNFFYENNGDGSFVKIYNLPFLKTGEQPMSAVWGDLNNDGHVDLVVGSYQYSKIYYSNGDKTFKTAPLPSISGNSAVCTLGDLNLDGLLDIIFVRTGQSALYYMNKGEEVFQLTEAGDFTNTTLDFVNSGSIADYDNDGDLDIFVANGDEANLLFENKAVVNNWVSIKLVGIESNSQGIGAKVSIKASDEWQTREIGVMSSYRSQNSVNAHFGLLDATKIDSILIEWPSGNIQIATDAALNTTLTFVEANTFIPTSVEKGLSYILEVFPNPVREDLLIKNRLNNVIHVQYEILDCFGHRIKQHFLTIGSDDTKLDVRELAAGVYIFRTIDNSGSGKNVKFVKR